MHGSVASSAFPRLCSPPCHPSPGLTSELPKRFHSPYLPLSSALLLPLQTGLHFSTWSFAFCSGTILGNKARTATSPHGTGSRAAPLWWPPGPPSRAGLDLPAQKAQDLPPEPTPGPPPWTALHPPAPPSRLLRVRRCFGTRVTTWHLLGQLDDPGQVAEPQGDKTPLYKMEPLYLTATTDVRTKKESCQGPRIWKALLAANWHAPSIRWYWLPPTDSYSSSLALSITLLLNSHFPLPTTPLSTHSALSAFGGNPESWCYPSTW